MKQVQVDKKVSELEHAPWNPRTPEELSPDNAEMQKLVASIREVGVLEPVGVWSKSCDDPIYVIFGNRRFAAAKIAGLDKVPAIEFNGISLAKAQELTRIENEVRIGVDPIKDSELIASMLDLGFDQKEIAAHFGVSEATICRRAKLIGLHADVRKIYEERKCISTDALERIALYPADVQEKCMSSIRRASNINGKIVHWSDIRWSFSSETKDLSSAIFDTTPCQKCPHRTGAMQDLFEDPVKEGELGSCMSPSCFTKHCCDHISALVRAKVGAEYDLVDGEAEDIREYEIEDRNIFTMRKSKKYRTAWWYYDHYEKKFNIYYGPNLAEFRAILATEAAAEKEKEERERKLSAEEKAKRAEKEAAERAMYEERGKLQEYVYDAARKITDKIPEYFGSVLSKHVLAGGRNGLNKEQLSLVTNVISSYFEAYDIEDLDKANFLVAFPAIMKELKVPNKDMSAFECAKRNLASFKEEHNLD